MAGTMGVWMESLAIRWKYTVWHRRKALESSFQLFFPTPPGSFSSRPALHVSQPAPPSLPADAPAVPPTIATYVDDVIDVIREITSMMMVPGPTFQEPGGTCM